MALKFWNIGKANARIDELEKLLAEAKAAKPADEVSINLAEALSSNETISVELTETKTALQTAQEQVNSIGGALKAACAELKIELPVTATSADMVSALKTAVSGTLAKLHVKAADIPAPPAKATANSDNKVMARSDFEKMRPKAQMDFMRTGGRLTE